MFRQSRMTWGTNAECNGVKFLKDKMEIGRLLMLVEINSSK